MSLSGIRAIAPEVNLPTTAQASAPSSQSSVSALPGDSVALSSKNDEELQLDSGAPYYRASQDVRQLGKRMLGDCADMRLLTIAEGTEGNDTISVRNGKEQGSLIVNVNGEETTYSKDECRHIIIDGGDGDDTITVDKSVTMGLYITGGLGNDAITGGSGDDTIIDNFGHNVIHGGKGDDTILANGLDFDAAQGLTGTPAAGWSTLASANTNGNIIDGGPGNDYIEGGRGNDKISGGSGNDVIYGLNGNDEISGGSGNDYIDGGRGNDTIRGQIGNNMLFGGLGDDSFEGGVGRDVIVTGRGQNSVKAGLGGARIYSNGQDTISSNPLNSVSHVESSAIPANILVGSDPLAAAKAAQSGVQPESQEAGDFDERVQSDLEALSGSPVGQKMLDELGKAGHQVGIVETNEGNSCSYDHNGVLDNGRHPGSGSDSVVQYNRGRINLHTDAAWRERPAVVGLYHEMAHSYNAATGTFDSTNYDYEGNDIGRSFGLGVATGGEFQAVGIDNGKVQQNPDGLNENSLRKFLGIPNRDRY